MTTERLTSTLTGLLQEIPALVPLTRIDRAWVFPPRVVGEVESGLVVLSLRSEEEPDSDQREVVTVRYEVKPGKGKSTPSREVASRGWAPSARVPLVMAGVVRRSAASSATASAQAPAATEPCADTFDHSARCAPVEISTPLKMRSYELVRLASPSWRMW